MFWPCPTEKRPWSRLRRHWRDYWKCPGVTVAPDQKDNWQYLVLKNVSVEMMDLTPTAFAVSHVFYLFSVFLMGNFPASPLVPHTPPHLRSRHIFYRGDVISWWSSGIWATTNLGYLTHHVFTNSNTRSVFIQFYSPVSQWALRSVLVGKTLGPEMVGIISVSPPTVCRLISFGVLSAMTQSLLHPLSGVTKMEIDSESTYLQ